MTIPYWPLKQVFTLYNMPEMVNHCKIFMHAGFSMHLVEDLCELHGAYCYMYKMSGPATQVGN